MTKNYFLSANYKPFQYSKQTHTSFSSGEDITYMDIKFSDVVNALKIDNFGSEYWKITPIKITVFNYDSEIIQYYLQIGGTNGTNADKWRLSASKETNLLAGQTAKRTISSVSYNSATDILRINFAGTTTRPSLISISYAL